MTTIPFIVLIVLLLGALPAWPYSANWGYYPSGLLGLVLSYCGGDAFDRPSACLADGRTAK